MNLETTTPETIAPPVVEVEFDENGQTVATRTALPPDEVATPDQAPQAAKFRIGDREFATEAEALSYATSQVSALETEQQVADAYRQGIRDAAATATPPAAAASAPPAPALNTDELYTNPQAFLDKFAHKIRTESDASTQAILLKQVQGNQVWSEFAQRHPEFGDLRGDVESFVDRNIADVQAIVRTKGQVAGYDYIATKMKSNFARYEQALKPRRALPNTPTPATPKAAAGGVTPEPTPKKPLSFAEQLRQDKARRMKKT